MQQITKDKHNKAFGLFFILLGVGYILINYFLGLRQMQLQEEIIQMGTTAIVTQNLYSNFSSLFYSFFTPVVPYLCIFLGALIYSGKRNIKATMITGIIIHALYILSIIVVNYIAYAETELMVMMYDLYSDTEEIANLIRTVILPKQILPTLFYLLYSSAFIVVSTIFLAGKRYKNNNQNAKTAGVVGVILMLIAFAVIGMIQARISNIIIGKVFGTNMLVAQGSVYGMNITSLLYSLLCSFIVFAPLLFEKMNRKKLLMITLCMIVTIGIVDLIISSKTLVLDEVSDEIYSETLTFLIQKIFLNVLALIARTFWFDSAERNTAPLWLQISLPLAVPILWCIFIGFIEIPLIYSSQSVYFLDLALVHNYILIIVLSLTVKYRRKSNFISQ